MKDSILYKQHVGLVGRISLGEFYLCQTLHKQQQQNLKVD